MDMRSWNDINITCAHNTILVGYTLCLSPEIKCLNMPCDGISPSVVPPRQIFFSDVNQSGSSFNL